MSEQGSHAAPTTIEALEEALNESVAAQTAAAEITTRVAVRLIAALARKLHPGATRVNLDDSDQGPYLVVVDVDGNDDLGDLEDDFDLAASCIEDALRDAARGLGLAADGPARPARAHPLRRKRPVRRRRGGAARRPRRGGGVSVADARLRSAAFTVLTGLSRFPLPGAVAPAVLSCLPPEWARVAASTPAQSQDALAVLARSRDVRVRADALAQLTDPDVVAKAVVAAARNPVTGPGALAALADEGGAVALAACLKPATPDDAVRDALAAAGGAGRLVAPRRTSGNGTGPLLFAVAGRMLVAHPEVAGVLAGDECAPVRSAVVSADDPDLAAVERVLRRGASATVPARVAVNLTLPAGLVPGRYAPLRQQAVEAAAAFAAGGPDAIETALAPGSATLDRRVAASVEYLEPQTAASLAKTRGSNGCGVDAGVLAVVVDRFGLPGFAGLWPASSTRTWAVQACSPLARALDAVHRREHPGTVRGRSGVTADLSALQGAFGVVEDAAWVWQVLGDDVQAWTAFQVAVAGSPAAPAPGVVPLAEAAAAAVR